MALRPLLNLFPLILQISMATNPTSHKATKGNEGFSLIEMLAYISILVFMLVIILEVVISITSSGRIITSIRNIENSAILSMERITREIRQADSINLTQSTLGTHPGKLVLIDSTNTTEFYISNNMIFIKKNGVELGSLTATGTKVTNLKFSRFATSTSEGIRVEMRLESGTSTHYRTETFYNSATIR